MDLENFASGFQALLIATPNISTLLTSFPGEDGNIPALFRNRAPQEAQAPFLVWHHVVTPIKYDSCGEVGTYETTVQIDLYAQDMEELDGIHKAVTDHVSFIDGAYADIDMGAVFISDNGPDENEAVDTDGELTSPFRRIDLRIHWTPTT
jgi:hypothetical protein